MAKLIAGMASSHAATLDEPSHWDAHRLRNRETYRQRYGSVAPEQPQIATETDDDLQRRYGRIRDGLNLLREKLGQNGVETLVFVGDDQNENFTATNLPAIAIYIGDDFLALARDRKAEPVRYRSDAGLAEAILAGCIAAGVDMAAVRKLPDNVLLAHAFGPVLRVVDPEARLRVVPIFVNAIHVPTPPPPRCYYYGEAIRQSIDAYPGPQQVGMYASGGMSHFTAGYPWKTYKGPYTHGAISEQFDRWLMETMQSGAGQELGKLTNQQIIENGEIELSSWITMLGAIGDVRPELLAYEPFYRAETGMAVGYWNLAA